MIQTVRQLQLGNLGGKEITGTFNKGDISTDAGALLVERAERKVGIVDRFSTAITDRRDQKKVAHSVRQMLRQRVFAIACAYEDCNDFDDLAADGALKCAVGRLPETGADLASQPTLSRLENSVTATDLYRMAEAFVDVFIQGHDEVPKQVIIDIDATDDPTHGQQQLTTFHGYYDEYCYLPLIVTARADGGADELLATVLRSGKSHAGTGAVAVLKRIVARLREAWPQVRIILRGDSGFAKPELYQWCEREGIEYLIGLITNPRLCELAEPYMQAARRTYRETGQKVRRLHETGYAAESWSRMRRVLIKAEVLDPGDNPRFVVTNMGGEPLELYDLYCMRGDQENRIKELKRDLAIDRTSCPRFAANQFRVLVHSAAFVLLSFMRRCLAGTELENAQVCTLQRKLLKLGVLIRETCRKVWMEFASSCPVQHLWPLLLDRMRA